jgi:sugar phosphate isomerase/epimerase
MKLCLFSVSYAGFWGQAALPLPEFITRAGRFGYASVMLAGKRPHVSPLDASPEMLQSLKNALKNASVSCDVIAGYTNFAPGSASEVPLIEFQIAYVESLARIAAELGASVVRVFTSYESSGQDLQSLWNRVVIAFREMSERAAAHGVTIAIQNHHDLGLHTDALLDLLADINKPNIKLGFDAWSPALRGENLYEAARKAAPHTAITTNADYVRVPRYHYQPALVNYERQSPDWVRAVPFGTGFIDYAAFFKGLREGGFNGVAVYEMCSPVRGGGSLENLDACAKQYVEWMKAHHFDDTCKSRPAIPTKQSKRAVGALS